VVRRVLFAMPTLSGGGAERVMVTVLRHLDRARFEPHLLVLDASGPYRRELPADVPLYALGASRLRRAIPALLRVVWRLRPAAIVSTQGYMNFALLLLRPLLPRTRLIVREVIGERYLENSRYRAGLYRWYLRRVRRADRIVTQSDGAAEELRTTIGARAGQVARIYNPVDVDRIARDAGAGPSPWTVGAARHVVAAGRLHRQKGFDLLLDAFAAARAAGVDADLTILGDGPDRDALAARAAALGVADRVRLAGFQENPFRFFAGADLFVLSSRYEGLPNVVLEALAAGCPVLAFACSAGVREVVRDGVNGRLLPPEDLPALKAALRELLENPAVLQRYRTQIPATLAPFGAPGVVRSWERMLDDALAS
jgi:glycosyltransferase involved in cell wall biosynthesis